MTMVEPARALPGRQTEMPVPARHAVLGTPLKPPFPEGLEQAIVGMGCFWGAERVFWHAPGVYTTAVGYSGGITPNPTYEEVCSARTGHTEAVLVVFDPAKTSYEEILRLFWENHDPTQGMRQGNDVGTQYRSAIYWTTEGQHRIAEASRDAFQERLRQRRLRRDHDRDRRGGAVLLRRGVPPAVPREEPVGLLRARRDRRELPGRVRRECHRRDVSRGRAGNGFERLEVFATPDRDRRGQISRRRPPAGSSPRRRRVTGVSSPSRKRMSSPPT